jgi:spore coat protein SA
MIRIVEICTDKLPCPPPKGGAIERYVFNLSKALSKIDVEVHLVTMGSSLAEDYKNVIVHSYDLSSPIAKTVRKLFSLLSSENANIPYITVKFYEIFRSIKRDYGEIDAIHNHYFTTAFAPLLYKTFKTRTMLLSHFHNEPKSNAVNKLLAQQYDVLLAVSNFVKKSIVERLDVREDRIHVIYNAVDTEVFKPCDNRFREDAREKLGLGDDFVVLFVGRIVWEKGFHHAVLALHYLIRRGYKCKLAILGPKGYFDKEVPHYFTKVRELANRLGLSNHIKYFGYAEPHIIHQAYCASDTVIVPSLWEDPCPIVVLEALASGRPVIAYSSGGIPEIIPPFAGIVVSKGDIIALVNALEDMLSHHFKFDVDRTLSYVRNNFTFDTIATNIVKLVTIHA